MAIKNYTTKVAANRSVHEIQDCLIKHGATGILMEYEQGTGKIKALKFILALDGQNLPFQLPVDWRAFQAVLKSQKVSRWREEEFCYRVAWRCIRDWVLAQMALIETRMVSIPQVFLPYAVTRTGETLYEKMAQNPTLLLE